jgi:hypothetical protein
VAEPFLTCSRLAFAGANIAAMLGSGIASRLTFGAESITIAPPALGLGGSKEAAPASTAVLLVVVDNRAAVVLQVIARKRATTTAPRIHLGAFLFIRFSHFAGSLRRHLHEADCPVSVRLLLSLIKPTIGLGLVSENPNHQLMRISTKVHSCLLPLLRPAFFGARILSAIDLHARRGTKRNINYTIVKRT